MGKTAEKITVRKLQLADLPWLLAMDAAAFSEAWTKDIWQEELNGRLSHYITLEQDGVPVAYGGFWLVAGEAQIMRLAVAPVYQGHGLGLFLVESLVKTARSLLAEEITLEVRASNVPAQRTYQHMGFMVCGRRPKYYKDNGEDAILMRLALTIEEKK